MFKELAVSLETVKDNFSRYGLLDEQVVFVEGMFSDTLPSLSAGPFALLRLDGDLYESTIVALNSLYPKLSRGGVVIIDDRALDPCDPFRELIPLAHSAGAWVHIDGAFGLFARASRTYRNRLDGVELADSWATDAHKWLNVPFDCGIAIVRDRAAHRTAMP